MTALQWFHHATERMNHYDAVIAERGPLRWNLNDAQMSAIFKRQRMIAYGEMTQAEKNTLRQR